MVAATARRNDSVGYGKGQALATPGPINVFNNYGEEQDNRADWRTQLLMQRHSVNQSMGDLIVGLHFGGAIDV